MTTTVNVFNIIKSISQKIKSGTLAEDELQYATKALELLKTGFVGTVTSSASLSSAVTNPGKIFYSLSEKAIYYSNGTYWISFSGASAASPASGTIWSAGYASSGQLGDGTTTNKCIFTNEISTSLWTTSDASVAAVSAIKVNGSLWSWGSSFHGNGTVWATFTCSPVREICSASNWSRVTRFPMDGSCQNGLAIKTDGSLWGWGGNSGGQLGNGNTTQMCSPVREICSATNWSQVSGGYRFAIALKTDGSLWGWGADCCGNLAIGQAGAAVTRCSPVREICSATNWCMIATSKAGFASAAIKTDNSLWLWGRTGGGDGIGVSNVTCSPIREVCSANDWCMVSVQSGVPTGAGNNTRGHAIKTNGTLWSWGGNNAGYLGNGTTTIFQCPSREFCSATNWCMVSAGRLHTVAIKTDGSLWAWGCNICGSFGIGGLTDSCSPVRESSLTATDWLHVSTGCHVTIGIRKVTV